MARSCLKQVRSRSRTRAQIRCCIPKVILKVVSDTKELRTHRFIPRIVKFVTATVTSCDIVGIPFLVSSVSIRFDN